VAGHAPQIKHDDWSHDSFEKLDERFTTCQICKEFGMLL
jgi:hypothetical protein